MVILQQMEAMLRSCSSCVLATASNNQPHCSLMAYATDANCRTIYMATHTDTRKYRNLQANPAVSVLIDTRGTGEKQRTRAMTVEGTWMDLDDGEESKHARRMLLSSHPHMEEFLQDPAVVILRIAIRSFLLLDGLTEAYFEQVKTV